VTLEIVLMWTAVTAYAAGSIAYAVGAVFRVPRAVEVATWVSLLGLAPHLVATGVRTRWYPGSCWPRSSSWDCC
jgi:hypothetical protein